MTYRMYGAEFSLYSGKLRSYLRKKGLRFVEKSPSILTYRRFIVPRTGVAYIPVLHTPDDRVIQDTTEIIDFLESRYPEPAVYPRTPKQRLAALLLEVYGDEWLIIPAMHYRWNFPDDNLPFIHDQFGDMLFPWLPKFLRRPLGRRVGRRFENIVPKLGVTERTRRAVETSWLALLADLDRHFVEHSFLLGERPSIGDFGLIGPMYAHLYRDPHPGRLMRERAPRVAAWVERMLAPQPVGGDFLPDDEVPDTLIPVLGRMAQEQIPVLIDSARHLARWRLENPGTSEIPRALGEHTFSLAGIEEQRLVLPYSLWMWQRPMDYCRSLTGSARGQATALLDRAGLPEPEDLPDCPRIVRANNRFVIET